MTSLRLLTWNVHQLRDDVDAVVDVLRTSGADVVALQEPPRRLRGGRRLRAVAERAGYVVAAAGGGARTTALLVRAGVAAHGARTMRLRWRPLRTRRGIAFADVGGIRVVSVHLSLLPAERMSHLVRILHVVASSPGYCVVAGDLNEDPGGPTWRALGTRLRDLSADSGPTFSARRPRRRIDAVLGTSGVRAGGVRRIADDRTEAASDHLPVVVDLHTA